MTPKVVNTNRGYYEVWVEDKLFILLYRVTEGFGRGMIKDGEWVVNRGPLAIDRGLFFPPVSYPTIKDLLDALEGILFPRPTPVVG